VNGVQILAVTPGVRGKDANGQRSADETAPASQSLARFPFPAPGTAAGGAEPVWRRALLSRTRERLRRENRSAKARLSLQAILHRAGFVVSLVAIHSWSRDAQGQAYLWAVAFLSGLEDVPAPSFVFEARDARSA
jgi:hypothetical protein